MNICIMIFMVLFNELIIFSKNAKIGIGYFHIVCSISKSISVTERCNTLFLSSCFYILKYTLALWMKPLGIQSNFSDSDFNWLKNCQLEKEYQYLQCILKRFPTVLCQMYLTEAVLLRDQAAIDLNICWTVFLGGRFLLCSDQQECF